MSLFKRKEKKEEKKAAPKKTASKKTAAKKTAPAKKAPAKKAEPKKEVKKAPAKKVAPKKEVKKPASKTYHVTPHAGKWQVKIGGGSKAIKVFDTQKEAIEYAKHLEKTQDGSLSIHKKTGATRKQNYSK